MTKKRATRHFPDPPEFLQAIVADVEQYPLFLPYLRKIEKYDSHQKGQTEQFKARAQVEYRIFRESFSCAVEDNRMEQKVLVTLLNGPIRHLRALWHFQMVEQANLADGEATPDTLVSIDIEVKFKNFILDRLVAANADRITKIMIDAFAARAKQLREKT